MCWTAKRFLDEWDMLFSPALEFFGELDNPARKSIAASAMAAFEFRDYVSRSRQWRHKSAGQIDQDFMNKVVLPLVRINPLVAGGCELLSWSYDYREQRGRKPSSTTGELEIGLSFLRQLLFKYSSDIKKFENMGMYEDVNDLKRRLNASRLLEVDVITQIRQKEAQRFKSVSRVKRAMKHLTSVGIPCSKIDVDAPWLNLLATVWGVAPNNIYSAARRTKTFMVQQFRNDMRLMNELSAIRKANSTTNTAGD